MPFRKTNRRAVNWQSEKRSPNICLQSIGKIVAALCLGFLAPGLAWAQPIILSQPSDQFVSASSAARFSVGGSGITPLAYQWQFDGVPMAEATNRILLIARAQSAQSGFYSVIVSNPSGSVTSQVAELKVFVAAPHSLAGIRAEADGSISLSFAGEIDASLAPYYDMYPLETSLNLVDWAPLATLQRTNRALDSLGFQDTQAPDFGRRFYRTSSRPWPTPDPQPTGPYSVGTFSLLLTNSLRHNAKFMVTFWYPAVAQAGVLPAKYVEPQVAQDGGYDLSGAGGGNFAGQAQGFFSHSLANAPLATNISSCPVLLYDPGAGGHRRENTDKTEDLASWGYVVVGLDAGDTSVSVFPNGTVEHGQPVAGTLAGAGVAIEGRVLDLQFVLDELEILNAGDLRLGGRLDLEKIGAFGWSLGGATVAQLCLRDPRCQAGAGLDGSYFETNLLTQPLSVPWLYFRSDTGADGDTSQVYNELLTHAYWVRLISTVHGSFSDYGLIVDPLSLNAIWGTPTSGQLLRPARVSEITRAYLLSFFNKFLRGEDDHLLDGSAPAYPEVIEFLSKEPPGASTFSPGFPLAGLVPASDGNFYGTTSGGGANGKGAVFQVTGVGALTLLVSFNGPNGAQPMAPLVQGSDGNFFGTTSKGGAYGDGTVFKMTAGGALTTLVSFNGTNGSAPAAALVPGNDGAFYGTTQLGGDYGDGTVFRMTAAGTLTTLVSFNATNGVAPVAALVQGSDGNLYGSTEFGGNLVLNQGYGNGTVFRVSSNGVFSTLATFSNATGAQPCGQLVQGLDGNIYGTTSVGPANAGSPHGFGTVFKLTATGQLTSIISFDGIHGSQPCGGLAQGSDGNFYGATQFGGATGFGTLFQVSAAGALTTLFSFNGIDGSEPSAGLAQGNDGNFYGATEFGGANGAGTVFKMTSTGEVTTLFDFGLQSKAP